MQVYLFENVAETLIEALPTHLTIHYKHTSPELSPNVLRSITNSTSSDNTETTPLNQSPLFPYFFSNNEPTDHNDVLRLEKAITELQEQLEAVKHKRTKRLQKDEQRKKKRKTT